MLVVEDSPSQAELVLRCLSRLGVTAIKLSNGEEALEWILQNPVDLLLLDYSLPDMKGSDLIRRLKEKGKEVPFVTVTGHGSEDVAVEMMKLGGLDYVSKTENFLELFKASVSNIIKTIETQKRFAESQQTVEKTRRELRKSQQEKRTLAIREDRLRSLGEMATGLAHELNQPLSGIRGFAETVLLSIQNGWELTDDEIVQKMHRIVQQTDRMSDLIEHVRAFSREAGKKEMVPTDMRSVLKNYLKLVSAQLNARGIQLETDFADGEYTVMANPFALEEVLMNLVVNARDSFENYDPEGLKKVQVRLYLKGGAGDDFEFAVAEIIDNGAGIPESIIDRIYDPFFTTRGPDRGTGLGLTVAIRLVEQMKGKLEIRSVEKVGTKARITMPRLREKQGENE